MATFLKTHEIIKGYDGCGFTRSQAEALVEWQLKIAENSPTTKDDLCMAKYDLKDFERQITRTVVAVQLVQSVLIVVLVYFMFLAR